MSGTMRKTKSFDRIRCFMLLCTAFPSSHQAFGFVPSFPMNPPPLRNTDLRLQQKQRTRSAAFRKSANLSQPTARFTPFGRKRKQDADDDASAIHMNFIGTEHVTTPSVPLPEDATVMDDYFSIEEYRALLFPKNDAKILNGPISDEMLTTWCREAELGGGTGPSVKTNRRRKIELYDSETEKQHVMKITAALQMPSLEIRSESTIGVKILLSDKSKDSFPEIQFTLLDSQLIPAGSSVPAKWIFNQLMKYRDSTSSFTRVTAERVDEKHIAFTTDARLETRIRLPSAVLKFLPSVNVSKFEQTGSESIQKLLEKDLEPALLDFRNAFKIFCDEKAKVVAAASVELKL
mmetsp:Transcript_807/g.1681  ORF Transcript_807/g.1681 Transcript_807/m.1681 type:complete len:348 (+) Transcript_807:46-1089(+)